jgi:hypothetical protein
LFHELYIFYLSVLFLMEESDKPEKEIALALESRWWWQCSG